MNKSESKYFKTSLLMIEALMDLLETKPFDYITIKEICQRAVVNRSTFYLHYDNTKDMLTECLEVLNTHFNQKFEELKASDILKNVRTIAKEKLNFINDDYLKPYLEYIYENRKVYKAIYEHPELFNANETYANLFNKVLYSIFQRFSIPKKDAEYMMEFYIKGTSAIVIKWVKEDCKEAIEKIVDLIISCIRPAIPLQ